MKIYSNMKIYIYIYSCFWVFFFRRIYNILLVVSICRRATLSRDSRHSRSSESKGLLTNPRPSGFLSPPNGPPASTETYLLTDRPDGGQSASSRWPVTIISLGRRRTLRHFGCIVILRTEPITPAFMKLMTSYPSLRATAKPVDGWCRWWQRWCDSSSSMRRQGCWSMGCVVTAQGDYSHCETQLVARIEPFGSNCCRFKDERWREGLRKSKEISLDSSNLNK